MSVCLLTKWLWVRVQLQWNIMWLKLVEIHMTVNSVVESAMLFILFIYFLSIYLFIWKFYILSEVWENNFKRLLKISFGKKGKISILFHMGFLCKLKAWWKLKTTHLNPNSQVNILGSKFLVLQGALWTVTDGRVGGGEKSWRFYQ